MKFGGECIEIVNNSEGVELYSLGKPSSTPFGV
jgi:hypothetical protein